MGLNSTLSTASGNYTQTGGSTLLATASSRLDPVGIVDILGGYFAGVGEVLGDLQNAGDVSPGLSAGILTVTGAYSQALAGILNIEIGGTIAATPDFDQLFVSGTATLSGDLNVSLINGFSPVPGATFIILNSSGGLISGTFTDLPEGAVFTAGISSFRISYVGGTGNDVVLTAVPNVFIDPVTVVEGNSGTVALNFNVRLAQASTQTVTVRANTSNVSTATPGDYTPIVNQLVTFIPGDTSETVTVLVNGDSIVELNETLLVTLSNPSNAAIVAAPANLVTFNSSLSAVGLAFDHVTGHLFVAHTPGTIHEFQSDGNQVLPTIPMPGGGSSSFDLDFLPVPVNVGGTVVPAGTLLAANGGNELHAINKDTGAVLATRTMSGIGGTVGMTYHAGRNSVFVVNFSSDMITEVNPETGVPINPGTGINTFTVRPPAPALRRRWVRRVFRRPGRGRGDRQPAGRRHQPKRDPRALANRRVHPRYRRHWPGQRLRGHRHRQC